MTHDTPPFATAAPPMPALPVEPIEPVAPLAYATRHEYEAALFRFLGKLGIVIAVLSLLRIFIDVSYVAMGTLPSWSQRLFFADWKRGFLSGILTDVRLLIAFQPIIMPAIALFLLAGSIGCLRRYPRTRWWLITYAILSLLNNVVFQVIQIYQFQGRRVPLRIAAQSDSYAVVLELVASFALQSALPIILLWLMTRRNVDKIFRPG